MLALILIAVGVILLIIAFKPRKKKENIYEHTDGWMERGDFLYNCISGSKYRTVKKDGSYVIKYYDGERYVGRSNDVFNHAEHKARESKRNFIIRFYDLSDYDMLYSQYNPVRETVTITSDETPKEEPQVIVKEVIKEVPVEVIKEVEVVKEVVKEVPVEAPKEEPKVGKASKFKVHFATSNPEMRPRK